MNDKVSNKTVNWLDILDEHVRERLGNCVSRKSDILPLAQAKWAVLKNQPDGWTPEDALVQVLELLDCNDQFFDLSRAEYDGILYRLI